MSNASIIPNSGEVLLEQLNPGTEYSVRIKAINVIGEGGGTEDTTMTRDRGEFLYSSVWIVELLNASHTYMRERELVHIAHALLYT